MEPAKVTNQPEVISMPKTKQSLVEQIATTLHVFNQRLEARLRKNQTLLENMRAEEDIKKSMGYMKEFFEFKGGD